MKSKLLIQSGIAITLLLAIAFSAGQAYASTGCFNDTNGHWAESFICWMKDNGITAGTGGGNYSPENPVTRAEMAVFMQRLADIPPSQGDITISASAQIWDSNNSDDLSTYVSRNFAYNEFFTTIPANGNQILGNHAFIATIPIPTTIYNTQVYLDGMQICYDAWYAAYINSISLVHFQGTDGAQTTYSDYTDRNGEGCVNLALPTSVALSSDDYVTLYMVVQFPDTGTSLRLRSSALYLHVGNTVNSALDPSTGNYTIMESSSKLP